MMRLKCGDAQAFAAYLKRESDRYYEEGKFAGGKELADASLVIEEGMQLSSNIILNYKRFLNLRYGA